jgi:hypothetical protein
VAVTTTGSAGCGGWAAAVAAHDKTTATLMHPSLATMLRSFFRERLKAGSGQVS